CAQGTFAEKLNQNRPLACAAVAWHPQRTPAFRRLAAGLFLRFFRCFAVLPPGAAKPKLPCACSALPGRAVSFLRRGRGRRFWSCGPGCQMLTIYKKSTALLKNYQASCTIGDRRAPLWPA